MKIASHVIVRENDQSIFDARRFKIYRFNQQGFKLIAYLNGEGRTQDQWCEFAQSQGVPFEDFFAFREKCVHNEIILDDA